MRTQSGKEICMVAGCIIIDQLGSQVVQDIKEFQDMPAYPNCGFSGKSCVWYCKVLPLNVVKIRRRIEDRLRKGSVSEMLQIAEMLGVNIE